MNARVLIVAALASALLAGPAWLAAPVRAQSSDATGLANTRDFAQADGAQVYATICAGCHMPDGQGARGAGEYPALAANPKLAAAPYVEMMVLSGNGAMPGFAGMLSDRQVAEVTTYVRTHFGNRYDDVVTEQDVKALRASLATASAD
ncbi:putative cytochrome c551 [Pseudoxanthomonas spadix BD-a59]|jgi:mono/diheme cytochrome c family protein|uniref:Cytochrome c551 n=1 Tax=Pseudoxanthomonas spadix (strain BD-a59) TaxID=1045855 RepID=G7UN28_PSEUP|nr:cytochrome c [Pseudoxanthomonas spadix]AER55339.1 putative cytochrome c551 [Pseudoxanthomonas spadix BD-a59]